MSWDRTGTVAVTNGSKTVTGVGTLFTTAVNVGDAFALVDANLNPTGAWYEVESVTNNTTLVLKQSYEGSTGSNKQYCVFNLVGNMTTPSFAQRLATFFASFQSLIDKPTATPTAASIPVADANGDIDSGWIAATFFNKTNILGTVSQSGGIPTGAVIERGSNENGEYTKFADGTMICLQNKIIQMAINTAYGSLYTGTATEVFPVQFSQVPSVSAPYMKWGTSGSWGGVDQNISTHSVTLRVYDVSALPIGDTRIAYIAIGRWY